MNKAQSGFTLVEIAIALVIIGLLLGGVLKGQELIVQAKTKNIVNDINGVSTAVYGYQDRYKKLPGDDDRAEGRWTAPATKKGDGNGAVGAANVASFLDCTLPPSADGENCRFWQHLRLSGFLTGEAGSALPPQNAVGGAIQVQNGALELAGLTLCTPNLPGKIAIAIDAQLDDGHPGTGQVRSTNDATKLNTKLADNDVYKEDGSTVYAVCKTL